jgi:molybdopterin molybdotransferase
MSASLPSYAEAAAIVAKQAAGFTGRSRTAIVSLAEAQGHVLAEPVCADRDMPAFPRSTRDGFACRAVELSAGRPLRVAGSTRAGQPPAGPLPRNSVWEIMTGAAVPEDADAVVMLEHVEQSGGKARLSKGRSIEPGENIVLAGAEAQEGQQLIPSGERITASHIAAAATCGYAKLEVFARPRVAIVTTGDELVAVETAPGPAQIRNSNAPMLSALVAQAGGEPWVLPTARDTSEDLERVLREAAKADMLLVSGGVSAGKFDLVEPVLAGLGAKFHFTGVRIQPGKPLVFGELAGGQPLFGLPGNPISSAATFLLFGRPVLSVLCRSTEAMPRFATARLTRNLKGKPNLTRFVPSACRWATAPGEMPEVEAVNWHGSGDLAAFARANCFAVVPEGTNTIREGETVSILPFGI